MRQMVMDNVRLPVNLAANLEGRREEERDGGGEERKLLWQDPSQPWRSFRTGRRADPWDGDHPSLCIIREQTQETCMSTEHTQ